MPLAQHDVAGGDARSLHVDGQISSGVAIQVDRYDAVVDANVGRCDSERREIQQLSSFVIDNGVGADVAENENVVAAPAAQGVMAPAAIQNVVTAAAVQQVIAEPPK